MQSINMIMIYYWDNKQIKLHDILKKNWFDISSSKGEIFYLDVLQMTAIALFLSNKTLWYKWIASILRHFVFRYSGSIPPYSIL